MTRVVIFGAGGLGQLVRDILLHHPQIAAAAFLDSDPQRHGETVDGLEILGGLERIDELRWQGVTHAVVAIGRNADRLKLADALTQRGLALASAIHPLATFAGSAKLGTHLIIGARVLVCVHAVIEDHCVLSAGAIVEHDNRIERGAFLHPAVRLAGGVTVRAGATLGIGASVIPGRTIGRAARVEPGAVVIGDVPDGATVSGAPAIRIATPGRFVADSAPPRRARAQSAATGD